MTDSQQDRCPTLGRDVRDSSCLPLGIRHDHVQPGWIEIPGRLGPRFAGATHAVIEQCGGGDSAAGDRRELLESPAALFAISIRSHDIPGLGAVMHPQSAQLLGLQRKDLVHIRSATADDLANRSGAHRQRRIAWLAAGIGVGGVALAIGTVLSGPAKWIVSGLSAAATVFLTLLLARSQTRHKAPDP